jgi:hypothetical protein
MTRPTNQTECALMGRGIDFHSAQRLRKAGWTLAKLASSNEKKLVSLGLTPMQVTALSEGRPQIPTAHLIRVLFDNRFLCCVCRNPTKSIVIHHISPWAKSRRHSVSNLAVLCLDHHGEAHTTRTLGVSQNALKLRGHKKEWEAQVRKLDPVAIQSASRVKSDAWYFFNHLRLFELAEEVGIRFTGLRTFQLALAAGTIDRVGMPLMDSGQAHYMYSGGNGIQRYAYVKEVMERLLTTLRVTNISDYLDRGTLPSIVAPGDFVYVQGAHTFSTAGARTSGKTQSCKAKRRANHIEVRFTFNRWEATSNSAWATWLSGRQAVGSLVQVKRISRVGKRLVLDGTAIGISAWLDGLKSREYGAFPTGAVFDWPDDDEVENEDDD